MIGSHTVKANWNLQFALRLLFCLSVLPFIYNSKIVLLAIEMKFDTSFVVLSYVFFQILGALKFNRNDYFVNVILVFSVCYT